MEIAMMDHEDSKEANCIMEATWPGGQLVPGDGTTREAPTPSSKNHINFRCQKRTQKLAPCTACLGHDNLSLSVLLMKEVPCFQSLQSRRFEARRGLAEATPRTQNVLAQGQSEAYGDSKLYNTVVEVPSKVELEVSRQLCCLARILGRSWRRGTASRQALRLQVDGNCRKTKSL